MTKDRLYILDTTLRDGQQTQGVQFSAEEKHQIAKALDQLGVDYIGRLAGSEPDGQCVFRPSAKDQSHLHRFRHDQTRRAFGGE